MNKWKAVLGAGGAGVLLIQPAQAQSEGESAPAADGADRQGGLGEIVVTARRQEERLQDVPIAVSVVSQEQMDQRGSFNPVDLVQTTPGLAVSDSVSEIGSETCRERVCQYV